MTSQLKLFHRQPTPGGSTKEDRRTPVKLMGYAKVGMTPVHLGVTFPELTSEVRVLCDVLRR